MRFSSPTCLNGVLFCHFRGQRKFTKSDLPQNFPFHLHQSLQGITEPGTVKPTHFHEQFIFVVFTDHDKLEKLLSTHIQNIQKQSYKEYVSQKYVVAKLPRIRYIRYDISQKINHHKLVYSIGDSNLQLNLKFIKDLIL